MKNTKMQFEIVRRVTLYLICILMGSATLAQESKAQDYERMRRLAIELNEQRARIEPPVRLGSQPTEQEILDFNRQMEHFKANDTLNKVAVIGILNDIKREFGQARYDSVRMELNARHKIVTEKWKREDRAYTIVEKRRPSRNPVADKNRLYGRNTPKANSDGTRPDDASLQERMHADVATFLRQHIVNDATHPLDNFCGFVLDKACDYYGVDELTLITKQLDNATTHAVASAIRDMTAMANDMMRQNIDDWNQRRKIPTWNEFAEGKSNKQILSALTVMSALNDGSLPEPIGSDDKYHYYKLNNSVARVTKQGATIDVVSCDNWRIQQDLQHFVESDGRSNPLGTVKNAFQFEETVGSDKSVRDYIRSFTIAEDGGGSESYYAEEGKKVTYIIQKPEIEILSEGGEVRVKNAFMQRESSPWTICPALTYNVGIKPSDNVKLDSDGASLSTGKLIPGGSLSYKQGREAVSVSAKGKLPDQTYIKGKYKQLQSGAKEISAETGKEFDVVVARANAGVSAGLKEHADGSRSYQMAVNGGAKAINVEGSISLGADITPGRSEMIKAEENVTYRSLPANLQERLIDDLFQDASTKVISYRNATQMGFNAGGLYEAPAIVFEAERNQIWGEIKEGIRKADIPDIIIAPSDYTLYEDTCFPVN